MEYVIDLDNTMWTSTIKKCECCGRNQYEAPAVNLDMVKKVNALYDSGCRIILWTGRGWDAYKCTKRQVVEAGIKHHELIMGKPLGIYVDADAVKTL